MIEDSLSGKINHLHSVKKLIEGFNDPNTNVAIILGLDSSERRATQTRGRVIRKTTTNKKKQNDRVKGRKTSNSGLQGEQNYAKLVGKKGRETQKHT